MDTIKIGTISEVYDSGYLVYLNKSVKPVFITTPGTLMFIPMSYLRENVKSLSSQFIDSLLESLVNHNLEVSDLSSIKVNLFKDSFNSLLESTEEINESGKRELIGQEVINQLSALNKNPYSMFVDLLGTLSDSIVMKSRSFKSFSNQIYKEFSSKTKYYSTDKNGRNWAHNQNTFDSIRFKRVIEYGFSSQSIPSNSKFAEFCYDSINSLLALKMVQYYDCFDFEYGFDNFYCYTPEYLKEYQQEIQYLLDPSHQSDLKIFLKYCLTLLKDINDGSWRPNLLLLHDHTIPHYNKMDKSLSKSFSIYKKLLKRCLVSYNKESSIHIKAEICSKIRVDESRQLEYLLEKLKEITSHQSISELRERINGNKFIDLSDVRVKSIISNDQLSYSRTLNFDGKRRIIDSRSFTIDSTKTKDVDDAIGIVKEDNGEYSILVHISDVTDSIKPFSDLFNWATYKTSSLYLSDSTHFMLPSHFNNHLSLEPNKENKCLTYQFKVSPTGQILDYQIFPSIVKNMVKTNYDKVSNSINAFNNIGGGSGDIQIKSSSTIHSIEETNELNQLYNISLKLKKKRELKGISAIHLPKSKLEYNSTTKKYEFIEEDSGSISNILVSEIMIATNWISANFSIKNNLPIPFRVQTGPDFNSELEGLSKLNPIAGSYLLTRQFKKGTVDHNNIGHFSLGLEGYAWSTSPIRRFPDMLVHTQIKNYLLEKQPLFDTQYLIDTLPHVQKNLNLIKKIQRTQYRELLRKILVNQGENKLYRAVKLSNIQIGNKMLTKYLLLDIGLLSINIETSTLTSSNINQELDDKIYLIISKFDINNQVTFQLFNEYQPNNSTQFNQPSQINPSTIFYSSQLNTGI